MKGVKRVWEVCEPHPDVFSRDPDPSLFAISLFHVAQGLADKDYTDAERFFLRTFMTRALADLLERVLGRLSGKGRGAPVLRLETPFGGGKTHTMTALYHAACSPEALDEHEVLRPILDRLGLEALPRGVRVAVLDGRGLDVRGRTVPEGFTIRTLWGELAYQLGGREGYELLAEADRTLTSPGGRQLTELFERYQPALVLMDEVLEYLLKARAVRVGDSSLMEQTGTFLGELTSAVSATPRGVLVLALPASSLEIPAESQEVAERLFQYAKKVLGRMELVETPVAQDEIFGVLRRRLFQNTGNERDHRKAVEALRDYYDEYARFFPDRLRSPDYRERMLAAYPFHPELIDLLYERWGPHPQFQRTRGALRLLALVLRRLWSQRPGSAILIQPHHVDLADRHIRGEVVRLLDSGFDAIVTGDVLGRSQEIDRALGGEYHREQLGRGAATCIFLYSISAATRDAGATEEEIRTALLRPEVNPAMVSEVLGRLRERLWYLRYRDRRYLFSARPNLNKMILDFENEITDEQVEGKIAEWLVEVSGKGKGVFQVVVAPKEPQSVPDCAQPTLVVLPPGVANPEEWMTQALESVGGNIRTNKNMLVFLAPDTTQLAALQGLVRRYLALEEVAHSPSFREMEPEDREQVQEQLREKRTGIEGLFLKMYQDVYRPGVSGVKKVSSATSAFPGVKTLDEYARQLLEKNGILLERIAPEYLQGVLQENGGEVSLSQVNTIFTGVVGQPLLKNPKEAITGAIREGVRQGIFGIQAGSRTFVGEEVPEEVLKNGNVVLVASPKKQEKEPGTVASSPESGAITLTVQTSANLLYPLLQAAQRLRELQGATVLLRVDDPTGAMRRLKQDLEKLLRDYGCTVEWEERQS